jgi:hypothetical protein
MKNHTAVCKTTRKTNDGQAQGSSGGENAVAIAPPNYGINFVDSGMTATAPIQCVADKRSGIPVNALSNAKAPDICSRSSDCNDRLVGAGVGALAGGLAGAAIGAVVGGPVGALVGAGIGGLVGGIAGALIGGGCTASATGVALGASSAFNDSTQHGLITPIIVRGTELADVQDSELVSASLDHHGSFSAIPSTVGNTSGFMAANNIPPDRHLGGNAWTLNTFDSHGGDGDLSFLQMDLFKIPKCNINTAQDMPNSGYRIKRTVKTEGTKVVGIVTKTAEAVSIGGHSSTPGLTAKKEAKVTLRP